MLVVHCPSCGAPAPVSLANEGELRCDACGHVGAMPAEAAGQLRAAGQVLSRVAASERQLSERQRRALGLVTRPGRALGLVLGLTVTPLAFLCLALFSSIADEEQPDRLVQALSLSPLVLSAAAAGLGWRAALRGSRALAEACAAWPPSVPGGAAGCRVCGAPLLQEAEAVVRCGHCASDNLVDAAVLARLAAGRTAALADFGAVVESRAVATRGLGLRVGLAVGFAVLASPVIAVTGSLLLVMGLDAVEAPRQPAARYALVVTPRGRCIASVVHVPTKDNYRVSFGDLGVPFEDRPTLEGLELVAADAFVHRRVLSGGRAVEVVRVFGTLAGIEHLQLEGVAEPAGPVGLCLAE